VDPYGVCAEWIASSLNGSVYTYEVAPVFTMMELEVFERMRNIIGFPEGQGDGLFCPGGSIANGYANFGSQIQKEAGDKGKGDVCNNKPMVMLCLKMLTTHSRSWRPSKVILVEYFEFCFKFFSKGMVWTM